MMTPEQILDIRSGGMTNRYHSENKVLAQDVGAHSWGVAMLAVLCHPAPSAELLRHCILHDVAERRGPGDVRYQAKRDNPELKELLDRIEDKEFKRLGLNMGNLSSQDQAWLKWADMAEIALHARELYVDCGYPCALKLYYEAVDVICERVGQLKENATAIELTKHLRDDCFAKLEKEHKL